MDHKDKLFARASSEGPEACRESTVDRLSSLPEKLVHHILSSFRFRQLVQVGSVSKRCREFYLSASSLDFISGDATSRQHQFNLLNSIDRFMILHGDNRIQRLRIDWDCYAGLSEEVFRIVTWIHIALSCNIEVLDLRLRLHKPDRVMLELPCAIYFSESLRSLFIDTDIILKPPTLGSYSNLQNLKLTGVTIEDGFCNWISCSCKCLKELRLDRINGEKFTIESSCLESFTFEHPYSDNCHLSISGEKLATIKLRWDVYETTDGSTCSLNIFAPNLKYLKWIGSLLNYQNLGKLTCLEKAHIFLKHNGGDYDFDNAYEVLCSIYRVKVLILTKETTKLLLRECSMLPPFDDVTYLNMHIMSLTDDGVPAMISLLKGMPHLNTLYIDSYPSLEHFHKKKTCGCNIKYWKSQNLDFIFELKEVSIALANGCINNELALARYILERAPNLRKMFILYLPHQHYVINRLNNWKKISPAATIIFQEREKNEIKTIGECFYGYLISFHNF